MNKPEYPYPLTIITSFLLMLGVLIGAAALAHGCDARDEKIRKSGYDEGYKAGDYDGYWRAKGEHGVF